MVRQLKYLLSLIALVLLSFAGTVLWDLPLSSTRMVTTTHLNFVDDQPTTSSNSQQCFRHCPHRNNKIIYSFINEAGLSDRLVILREMTNLAGYLCATPVFPRPGSLLLSEHNQGEHVDPRIRWHDFYNFHWKQDGRPILSKGPFYIRPELFRYETEDTQDYLQLKTTSQADFMNHLEQVEQFTWKNEINSSSDNNKSNNNNGFMWEIDTWWFRTPLHLFNLALEEKAPSNNTTTSSFDTVDVLTLASERECSYFYESTPPPMESFVDDIWSGLIKSQRHEEDPQKRIGFLHVRRGDAIDQCNTTLAKMKSFLRCSLQNVDTLGKQQLTILFATDEPDPEYRLKVQELIEGPFPNVKVLDVDKLIQSQLDQAIQEKRLHKRLRNNFYIYRIQNILREKVSFVLEQRRGTACPDCTPIVELLHH